MSCCSAKATVISLYFQIRVLHFAVLVGTIEELSQTTRTHALVKDQFETNFYSAVTIIKLVLPVMRGQKDGHIIVLSGTSKFCI
jgi:NAD(P)-dependent dehydrogenase (short-subunit alcohol dehydrogenase family)